MAGSVYHGPMNVFLLLISLFHHDQKRVALICCELGCRPSAHPKRELHGDVHCWVEPLRVKRLIER